MGRESRSDEFLRLRPFRPLDPLSPSREFLYIRYRMPEVIPIGSDAAGVELKARLREAGRGVLHGADVLVLPARLSSEEQGLDILRTWLDTGFAGGRHSRRVAKIDQEQE
jgi:hypothetical protein